MGFSENIYSPMPESGFSNPPESVSPSPSTRLFQQVIGRWDSSVPNISLIMPSLEPQVQSFIDRNDMWPALDVAYEVKHELQRNMLVTMQLIVETDAEAPDREELVIIYSVANKEYKEILGIWNDVSRRVHRALPRPFSDKIYVRLVKA